MLAFVVEESRGANAMETPMSSGSYSVPVSGECKRFSKSKWPVRASNDRRVDPPGPDSAATTGTK